MIRAFEIAGYPQPSEARFGGMLNAFRYGRPAAWRFGAGAIDRIVMLLADEPNLARSFVPAEPAGRGPDDGRAGGGAGGPAEGIIDPARSAAEAAQGLGSPPDHCGNVCDPDRLVPSNRESVTCEIPFAAAAVCVLLAGCASMSADAAFGGNPTPSAADVVVRSGHRPRRITSELADVRSTVATVADR